jgi:hypothetical protein
MQYITREVKLPEGGTVTCAIEVADGVDVNDPQQMKAYLTSGPVMVYLPTDAWPDAAMLDDGEENYELRPARLN